MQNFIHIMEFHMKKKFRSQTCVTPSLVQFGSKIYHQAISQVYTVIKGHNVELNSEATLNSRTSSIETH